MTMWLTSVLNRQESNKCILTAPGQRDWVHCPINGKSVQLEMLLLGSNNFPYSCAENYSGSTLAIPMVNFTFNSAVVSVKSQQVWGLGFSYSAFKETHFSCKSSNNSQSILFHFIFSWSLFIIRWDPSVTEKWINFKCDFCAVQFLTCSQCSTYANFKASH